MKIAIDIRPLMGGNISGVEKYIVSMLHAIFEQDTENEYILWHNAFRPVTLGFLPKGHSNVRILRTRWPNKLLNLCLSLLRWPKIDRLIERGMARQGLGEGIEALWVPDPRPAPVSKKCRKIVTFHDLSFKEFSHSFNFKTRLWHRLVRPQKEAREAWRIIAVSHFTRQRLAALYRLRLEKIKVIHEAVPLSFLELRKMSSPATIRHKYKLEKPYFLCLSTLDPRKNIQGAIRAYSQWRRESGKDVELVIAGKARPDIFASHLDDFAEGVRWIGFVEEGDKKTLYQEAIAFLYPSFYEGFGLPILEAMEAGTPVITSAAASMPEVAGKAAILIDPHKTEQLEKALREISENETLRQELIAKGKKQAASFSWERAATEFLALIRQMHQ